MYRADLSLILFRCPMWWDRKSKTKESRRRGYWPTLHRLVFKEKRLILLSTAVLNVHSIINSVYAESTFIPLQGFTQFLLKTSEIHQSTLESGM